MYFQCRRLRCIPLKSYEFFVSLRQLNPSESLNLRTFTKNQHHVMILRITILIFLILISWRGCYCQSIQDFKIEKIGKQINEFQLDSINLSSPLDYFLSRAQVRLSGKFKNWQNISSSMFNFSADEPDEVIDDDLRNYILNEILTI